MKTQLIVTSICIALLVAGYAFAGEGHHHEAHQGSVTEDHGMMQHEDKENMDETKTVEAGNKICPVSKQKVGGAMGDPVKFEYNGKIYNLCCAMCAKDFKKDPEKYIMVVEEEMKQYKKSHDEYEEGSEEGHDHEEGRHHHDHDY